MFNLSAFLTYAIVVTFTPGPNNITSLATAGQLGYRKTLNFMLGVATGFFIIMTLSSFFNLILINIIPKIKIVMTLIGTLYMLYLAYKISGIKLSQNPKKQKHTFEEMANMKTGLLMQFVNPKVIIYGITITSTFITPYFDSTYALLGFSLFLSLLALASTSCWAMFGSTFNKLLAIYQKQFNIIMSMLLLYSAYSILSGLFH